MKFRPEQKRVPTSPSHYCPCSPPINHFAGYPTASGLWADNVINNARIDLEDIKFGPSFSVGAFGEVIRGTYDNMAVAIKRLVEARRMDPTEREKFLQEAKLHATLRHERIVQFIEVAWDAQIDLCIVSEFMEKRDLRTHLQHLDTNLAPKGFDAIKIKIALHIIRGLLYLHGLRPIVVHRDLKSKNVLLTRNLDAKLTDCGAAKERGERTLTGGVGTTLWMAPEVVASGRYDEKADIFSFGVVLSELVTQKLPYANAREPGTDNQLNELAIANMVAAKKLTVFFTPNADPEMVAIAKQCVEVDPRQRPTANDVLNRMHRIYHRYHHG